MKAETEMFADGISSGDVVEAIVNAPAITKTLRSRSARRKRRGEKLYVIVGSTFDGVPLYTKGTIRRILGEETYYFFVSSKRWSGETP
jgi:hypothetical protein